MGSMARNDGTRPRENDGASAGLKPKKLYHGALFSLTDFKTKKIFVGGIRSTLTEADEFKNFFSKYGKVENHQIIRDHSTNRACGFGFIIFDSEEVVDDLLSEGNMIDLAGSKVEIKTAEPKKVSN
ncbi:unnamed protein product [Musa banksii]